MYIKMTKLTGVVKWFNTDKAFGFITCNEKDYFVHKKSLKGMEQLIQGQHVQFTLKPASKGEQAADVEAIAVDGNR
jgi:CspA family cold shock protein